MTTARPLMLPALTLLGLLSACSASGGAAPSAPSEVPPPTLGPCGPSALIEDGEDDNNQVIVHDGRAGYLYTYADNEGTQIEPKRGDEGGAFKPSAGGAEDSSRALRMHGETATANIVYAGLGLNFTEPKDVFDATRFGGIAFYAKRGPDSTAAVRVKVPDINTDPDGQVCSACYNDFGLNIDLTEEWQLFSIPFSKMKQESGWGAPRPPAISTDRLYAIQFQVKVPGVKYDIWVDNVHFVGCQASQ